MRFLLRNDATRMAILSLKISSEQNFNISILFLFSKSTLIRLNFLLLIHRCISYTYGDKTPLQYLHHQGRKFKGYLYHKYIQDSIIIRRIGVTYLIRFDCYSMFSHLHEYVKRYLKYRQFSVMSTTSLRCAHTYVYCIAWIKFSSWFVEQSRGHAVCSKSRDEDK